MNIFYRNVPVLAFCQAMMVTAMSLILTVSALAGQTLASDKALATLPLAAMLIAGMLTSIPAAMWMQKFGRKSGFQLGAILGVVGALVSTYAMVQHDFWLLVAASFLVGIHNGFGNFYRFTAADTVADSLKSKAIAYVLAGGVVAAILGPNLANFTKDSIAGALYAGSYASLIGIYLLSFGAMIFLKIPPVVASVQPGMLLTERSTRSMLTQAKFIIAMLTGMLGYGTMTFVMTATPLAMQHVAHEFSYTSFVIQWHVLAMFAPSFFTGHLIQRFGVARMMILGALLGFLCVLINLHGDSFLHFLFALIALGLSWNFIFISATTLLTQSYRIGEQNKAQAINDFIVFTSVAMASLFAGVFQYQLGWEIVNWSVIPALLIILISALWLLRIHPEQKKPVSNL